MGSRVSGDPPQPPLIADPLGENFTFAKVVEDSPVLSEWVERIAKFHPKIDTLLGGSLTLGEMREGSERLLKARDCFPVGRAFGGFRPSLTEVGDGLVPDLAPQRMV